MYGVNADGWLAVHRIQHRELIRNAERAAARRPDERTRTPEPVAPAIPVPVAAACC